MLNISNNMKLEMICDELYTSHRMKYIYNKTNRLRIPVKLYIFYLLMTELYIVLKVVEEKTFLPD